MKDKKKKSIRLFLPGFHTGTDWKITIAILYYIIVVLLSLTRGIKNGIVLFAALMALAYLIYGIMLLFSKDKKPVMSAVYILAAVMVIAGDGILMNRAGISVSDIIKTSSAGKYTASVGSKSTSSGSKQKAAKKQTESSSKQSGAKSGESGGGNSDENINNSDNANISDNAGASQISEADLLNPEEKVEDSLNKEENTFDNSENKANAIQLYYVEKNSMIYHKSSDCSAISNKKVYTITADEVKKRVMIPCGRCSG